MECNWEIMYKQLLNQPRVFDDMMNGGQNLYSTELFMCFLIQKNRRRNLLNFTEESSKMNQAFKNYFNVKELPKMLTKSVNHA